MSEYYYEIKICANAFLDEIASFLLDRFYNGIEESGNCLILRSDKPLPELMKQLQEYIQSLQELFGTEIELEITQEKKRNEDWISQYQKSVQPVEVGSFWIYPGWYEPKENKINIHIDPALAFGSGHHETTRGCLQAIQKYVKEGDEVLDVGTGSGILAIAASKLGTKADICDTDELAIEQAKKNFALNEAKFQEAWRGSAALAKKKYDIVIANIVADVLMMISSDLKNATKKEGIIILSGIIEKYRDRVYEKFSLPLVEEIQDGEWITMILRNRGEDGR